MIEAIREHLDDLEDLYLAEQRLIDIRAGKSQTVHSKTSCNAMTWKIELDRAAVRELDKLDRQTARRILAFLRGRVAALDDPRRLGEALKVPR